MRTFLATLFLLSLAGNLPAADQDLVKVLVARRDLSRGTKLNETDKLFKWAFFTKGEEPRDGVSDPGSLKGRVLLTDLAEDQPLRGRFVGTLLDLVPPGHRAMTIRVALDNEMAGFIQPGSRVDLVATMTRDGKAENRVMVADVLVLALEAKEKGEHTITLALKPEQVEKVYVDAARKATVVLRKPEAEPVLPPGHRAFSIKVEADAAVAGFILPGTRVDVLAITTKDGKAETRVAVSDVLVLAISTSAKPGEPMQITVAVKPDQVEKLAAVVQTAKLSVVLRRPGDGK